jgi:DUF2934 family protein
MTPERDRTPSDPMSPGTGSASDRPSEADIAARAYDRFRARGDEHGHDLDDWLEAERELLGEQDKAQNQE